jgi:methylmalonyl-CoA/ethylmalonyl-CoA epimerase
MGPSEQPDLGPPGSILYCRCGDIRAAFDRIRGGGAEVVHEPRLTHRAEDHELWLAFFRDPDANVFALMSEVPVNG